MRNGSKDHYASTQIRIEHTISVPPRWHIPLTRCLSRTPEAIFRIPYLALVRTPPTARLVGRKPVPEHGDLASERPSGDESPAWMDSLARPKAPENFSTDAAVKNIGGSNKIPSFVTDERSLTRDPREVRDRSTRRRRPFSRRPMMLRHWLLLVCQLEQS